jgi:hypothetical protein
VRYLQGRNRKTMNELTKKKVGYWTGKHFSKEHKEKLSKAKLGTHISVTRTMPERSPTHRRRISRALKAWWSVPENKEKMRLIHIELYKQKKAKGAND